MKKTLKRSIASLLAVLMVVFSVPFTAMAAPTVYGPSELWSHDYTKKTGVWWDESNPPTSEPDYNGYNDKWVNESWGDYEYTDGWAMNLGDPINIVDPDFPHPDLLDEYKPLISVYVTDYSTYDAKVYGTADKNALADCTIKDPNDLKAGDKIAVTFEMGGFDALFQAYIKGIMDLDLVKPGYYFKMGSRYTWRSSSGFGGTNASGVLGTSQLIGYTGVSTLNGNVDADTGEFASCAGSMYAGESKSVYVGADKRGYGENGIVIFTMSLEVQQNCKLSDAVKLLTNEGGSYCYPYAEFNLRQVRPELVSGLYCRYLYGFVDEGGTSNPVNQTIYGNFAPVNYYGATAEEPVKHVHDFTGAVAVSNGDGTHTFTCTAEGCDQSAGYQKTVECTEFTSKETTPPSCTEAGVTTWTCEDCGYQYTTDEPGATGHKADYAGATYEWVENAESGYDYVATVKCSACNEVVETIKANVKVSSSTATCTQAGSTTYTATFVNTQLKGDVKVVEGKLAPHTYTTQASDVEAKSATCTEAATYYVKCDVCGHVSDTETVAVGEPLGHDFTVDSCIMVSPATCEQKQLNKAKCSRCDAVSDEIKIEVGELAAHTPVLDEDSAVEPTFDTPGKYADTVCSVCGEVLEEGAERPAIAYYTITATAQNGTATANGKASVKVAVKGDVTLVATANEGYTFVGWSLNDKIVSTDETYTTKAIADANYVAIYELVEETQFTVVFTDQYGNVYSTQTVSSGSEIVPPENLQLAGFTFKGWSMTDEEIAALDANATITAIFERADADEKFTVTVENGTIGDTTETTAEAAYNDKLTVKAPEGAVYGKWMLDDTVVGYGTSYTFFVGTDITLTYVEDTDALVNAKPSVAVVATEKDANSHKVAFFATRTLAAGYEYVAAGFVYGKNMNADDLALANEGDKGSNENSGVVKVGYCSTDSEQFKLSYGLTSMSGTVSAKAFLAYVDSEGNTHIIYGTLQEYTY